MAAAQDTRYLIQIPLMIHDCQISNRQGTPVKPDIEDMFPHISRIYFQAHTFATFLHMERSGMPDD